MTTSALRRQVKNIVHNFSEAEIKVREATSNDPWGPSSTLMTEIADLTFNVVAFAEVMGMLWKRLNDSGKNWRHVYKALTLLDYVLKTGSERVATQCRENAFTIQVPADKRSRSATSQYAQAFTEPPVTKELPHPTLRDFQYVDRDGRDQGANVREKARQLVCLLRDEERLKQERCQALKTKERMAGGGSGGGGGGGGGGIGSGGGAGGEGAEGGVYGGVPPSFHPGRRSSQPSMAVLYGEEFSRSRGSPSSFNSSSSSPRDGASDLEQARPQTSGEEELQLQLALAMSREENQKQAVMPPLQEQHFRQGDESLLQKALDESRRESQSETQETSMLDLANIFGAPSTDLWNSAQAPPDVPPDPWDSVAVNCSSPLRDSPWGGPAPAADPAAAPPPPQEADPWDMPSASPTDPWEPHHYSPGKAPCGLGSPSHHATGVDQTDPFSVQHPGVLNDDAPRISSPQLVAADSDADPFDGADDSDPFGDSDALQGPFGPDPPQGRAQVNGGGTASPEMFDLSRLAPPLSAPPVRICRTPEAFLGPTGASLVNLDALVLSSPPGKAQQNPFLSGLTAPSPTNPFHFDQPRLTLNQMRPASTSPLPPHMLHYSPSLPLPLHRQHQQQPALSSSLTQSSGGPMDLPCGLPQPLLPLSPRPHPSRAQQHAHGQGHNPFL